MIRGWWLAAAGCMLLFLQTEVHGAFQGVGDKCDPPGVWKTGQALDEVGSVELGATVDLLAPVRTTKLQECVSSCCKQDNCSVATLKVQDKGTILCALYSCSPPEKCIFEKSAKLLSYDRTTAASFLGKKTVIKFHHDTSTEVYVRVNASTAATTGTPETTLTTVDTTVPFSTDATSNASVSQMAIATGTPSTSTPTTLDATSTATATVRTNSDPIQTAGNTSVHSFPASTNSMQVLKPILGLKPKPSTVPVLHTVADIKVYTVATTPSTAVPTELHNSTAIVKEIPATRTSLASSVEETASNSTTTARTRTTPYAVSPALEPFMKVETPSRSFNEEAWSFSTFTTERPSTKSTKGKEKTDKTNANSPDVHSKSKQAPDLQRPILIMDSTNLNVDLVPKAPPTVGLVIGLCLGLLLIFVVMGLIGKRILDVWQRRHYSRMDFLVDGMYRVT